MTPTFPASLRTHAQDLIRAGGEQAKGLARRAVPFVSEAPPRLGGGNHLYMFLHVWRLRRSGRPAWIVHQPEMDPWLEMFPALQDLLEPAAGAPRRAQRVFQWYRSHREFADVLSPFVEDVLLSSSAFRSRLDTARADSTPAALTINVRRGDYYSNRDFHRRFAVDHAYLFDLVRRDVLSVHPIDAVMVVSDDPAWCAEVLPRHFGDLAVDPSPRQDMFDDLAHLATAHRLVLSNSTFSYWGGYLNERLVGGPELRVWAPTFHERPASGPALTGGRFDVLSPRWSLLDNAPHEMTRHLD